MRRFLFYILALLTAAGATAGDDKGDKGDKSYAETTFTEYTVDLGFIKEEKGVVKCEFEFSNTGNAPLMIIDVKASCGCTHPEFPLQPIAPGKKGKIKVKYNPAGASGGFRKSLTVKTNGREKRVSLYIEGSVIPKK